FGYDYISVGENLALGPFASDAAVVEAWMGSPGHRANILNSRFTEIGVGAVRCVFEGRSTWLAVQHFGKPISDCPKVDASLGKTIEGKKATLAEMKERLTVMRTEIEASNPEKDPAYNNKISSYNSLVQEYNSLIGETKTFINRYNSQIAAFNACASS
ncbi:MAG: CAP domain-containing protein, partial [bacterium]|nr:CAP domain-containing protein [bacterium]